MLKHIVMFQFKMETPELKAKKLADFKTAFENLSNEIEVLRYIEVGLNANPNEAFDLILITHFDSMDHLGIYAKHPAHVAVGQMIAPYKTDRSCVDFLCEY